MDYPILTPQQLATHLRALRKARNLTQAELALRLVSSLPERKGPVRASHEAVW